MIGHLILAAFAVVELTIPVRDEDEFIASERVIVKLVASEVVITGKITHISTDTVLATWPPGGKEKMEFKVATVKIESTFAGADSITHVRVGLLPPERLKAKPPAIYYRHPEMKEGQEMLFFLTKHPTAGFYFFPDDSPPEVLKTKDGKLELEAVKKFAAVIADPMKGLKSNKAEVRAETAAIMVTKYRAYPNSVGETKEVPIPADESKLILKALTESQWNRKFDLSGLESPDPYVAFNKLRLSEKDGWKKPKVGGGFDFSDSAPAERAAFGKWLDGPGKDYVIKKLVPKKESDK